MADFWGNFGNALGQYEARKSPLGAALFAGLTGRYGSKGNIPAGSDNPSQLTQYGAMPPNPPAPSASPGQPQQPGAQPNQPQQPGAQDTQPAKTPETALKPVDATPKPLDPDAGSAHEAISFGAQPQPNVNISVGGKGNGSYNGGSPSSPGSGPLGTPPIINSGSYWDPVLGQQVGGNNAGSSKVDTGVGYPGGATDPSNDPNLPEPFSPYDSGGQAGGDTGGSGADPNYPDMGEDYALGGTAGKTQISRIAERGPEVAGGRIITQPSIVKLNKGDTVVPLTPRAGNKMQPDLLEGHIPAMKPQGEQMSRFQRYGQGKQVMR